MGGEEWPNRGWGERNGQIGGGGRGLVTKENGNGGKREKRRSTRWGGKNGKRTEMRGRGRNEGLQGERAQSSEKDNFTHFAAQPIGTSTSTFLYNFPAKT